MTAIAIAGLQLQPQSGLNFPWSQYVSKQTGAEDMSLGVDSSQATMTIIVDWDTFESGQAHSEILGYAHRNGATVQLSRTPPWRHPRAFWLYATRITKVLPHKFMGKRANAFGNTAGIGPVAYYRYAFITVAFESPIYDIKSDAEVGGSEWKRWTVRETKSAGEFISRNAGGFEWVAGTPAIPASPNNVFPEELGQLVVKTRLNWKWVQVPEIGLLDANGIATNQKNGIGKINTASFAGYDAQTLLLDSFELRPHTAPVWPRLMGIDKQGLSTQPRIYDVIFNIVHFDPPTDGADKGHNLAPHPTNGYWYLVQSRTGGRFRYETYDFSKLFQMLTSP